MMMKDVRKGLIKRLEGLLERRDPSELARLSPMAQEALLVLARADGKPVPKDRLCHQVNPGINTDAGDWAASGRAATVVCEVRARLGAGAVLTVRGLGYVLGEIDWNAVIEGEKQ
jgi:hypothetical protein